MNRLRIMVAILAGVNVLFIAANARLEFLLDRARSDQARTVRVAEEAQANCKFAQDLFKGAIGTAASYQIQSLQYSNALFWLLRREMEQSQHRL